MAPAPPPDTARPFFGRVESLRGLGALAVAAYHFSGCALHGVCLLPHFAWDHADPGQNAIRRIAVALMPAHAALMVFFVISGFLLRLSLEHGPQRPVGAAARFFLGRVFRVYPIVFVGTLLAIPFAPVGTVTPRLLLANALLLDVSLNGVLWALQVELIMAPIIVAFYYLERWQGPRSLVAIGLATTALAFAPSWAGWPPLSTNLFVFVLGMLIPTLGRRFVTGLSRGGVTAGTLVSFVALVLPNPCLGLYSRFSAAIEAYFAVALVSLVAYRRDAFVLKALDARPLRWLGLSSGSYYVLHMVTIPLMLGIVAPAVVPAAWSNSVPALVGLLVIAVWLVALAPVSLATYFVIESPGIALGRRLVRLFGLGKPSAPRVTPAKRETAPRIAA